MVSSLFVLGGVRSGKSRFAAAAAAGLARVAFVATARADDADMARRIARHRADRPRHWTTIEEPFDLAARLAGLAGAHDAVVVDCLTLWAANRMLRGDADGAILDEADALAALLTARRGGFILVSNEVGAGVHPETAIGRRYADVLGFVNQKIAAACDRVVLLVAGLPLTLKAQAPPEAPGARERGGTDAVEAP